MAMRAPHSDRSVAAGAPTSSWPSKRTDPVRSTLSPVSSPITERASTVLPEPDSPTTPRVRPWRSVSEAPSTARRVPRSVRNEVHRSSTTRRGAPPSVGSAAG